MQACKRYIQINEASLNRKDMANPTAMRPWDRKLQHGMG